LIQTLVKNWWLLALCGVLDAGISAIYFLMQGTDGPVLSRSWSGMVVLVGKLAMAAGVCTVGAAVWRSRNGKNWALGLNGVALAVLGFVQYGLTRFRISILVVAVLVVVMAVSIGVAELGIARDFRRRRFDADSWLFGLVGMVSVAVALPSLAFGLRWIPIEPGSRVDLIWLGCYFAFAAISTIAVAVRLHSQRSEGWHC
jgi:uncharacterized membrane protein HdeD (DUF308 family)